MHDSRSQHALMTKLADMREHAAEQFPLAAPECVARRDLEGFLRFSQAEFLDMFGEKSARNMPDTLRLAIVIVTRIHTGSECYGTIAESAHRLIKAMYPLYLARLKRHEKRVMENAALAA